MSVYHEELKIKETELLREVQADLPPFLREFFRGIAQTTSTKTRLAYAYDLRVFFRYLYEEHDKLGGMETRHLEVDALDQITSEDIECYLEYLSYYIAPDQNQPQQQTAHHNDEKGKARKLASVRSMYKYFYKKGKIKANPATIVDTPKIHEKKITRLDVNEMANLLDAVESGNNLTDRQKARHEKTKKRDLALITLLLGTGMRVSECVGINRKDLAFQNYAVKVLRKGGNFLSSQGKRISVRAVQNLVKKYAHGVTAKNITPHKLRSTYGTNLYQETGDIYLVADTLGHADVNTTRKHYAEIEENRRKRAASYIKLRKD